MSFSSRSSRWDKIESSWLEVLPQQKIFEHLRESCSGGSVNVTFARGNLFVWSRINDGLCDGEILTLNLNRLAAYPDTDCYQSLQCTKVFGEALGLIPDESGLHLAIHFHRGLTVLKLSYDRGAAGEFGGGKERVLCKNYSVAEALFVRYDQLTLLQICWYPLSPDTLALLTSDNYLRLYSLADPECPLLAVPLLHQCTRIPQRGRIRIEEENIIRFCIRDTSAFILHDNGDVSLVSLDQDTREHAPKRLRMSLYSSDDNEEIDSSGMLLLDTTPNLLVIAYKSGMIYHCICLEDSSKEGEEEESQTLYVRERIEIQSSRMDQSGAMPDLDMTLSPDPADPHSYFITSVEGIYLVRMPWLGQMEEFTTSSSNDPVHGELECEVIHLLHTELSPNSLLGMVVVYEGPLGYAMVSLTSGEWECLTLALEEPQCVRFEGGYQEEDDDDVDPSSSHVGGDNFVKAIGSILHPSKQPMAPILKSVGKDEVELTTQKDLYAFLQSRITQMKEENVSRQIAALTVMDKKIEMLKRLKEQIITSSIELRDEADIIKEGSVELRDKLQNVMNTNAMLLKKAHMLACKVRFLSPVLSEAEECMKNEMEGLADHIKAMKREVCRAGEKSKLFHIMSVHPEIDLNESQSTMLLKELAASGDKVKSLSALVKILCGLMRTC